MNEQEIKSKAHNVVSWGDAKALGMEFYYSGKPCKYNQVAPRFVSTRHCSCFICVAKQKYKEKDWAERNQDKERERVRRWQKTKRTQKCNPVFIKPSQ